MFSVLEFFCRHPVPTLYTCILVYKYPIPVVLPLQDWIYQYPLHGLSGLGISMFTNILYLQCIHSRTGYINILSMDCQDWGYLGLIIYYTSKLVSTLGLDISIFSPWIVRTGISRFANILYMQRIHSRTGYIKILSWIVRTGDIQVC